MSSVVSSQYARVEQKEREYRERKQREKEQLLQPGSNSRSSSVSKSSIYTQVNNVSVDRKTDQKSTKSTNNAGQDAAE